VKSFSSAGTAMKDIQHFALGVIGVCVWVSLTLYWLGGARDPSSFSALGKAILIAFIVYLICGDRRMTPKEEDQKKWRK